MNRNIILSGYEDKSRQMFAVKRNANSSSIDIIHRTLYPTKSNRFTTITVESNELETIVNSTMAKPYTINAGLNNIVVNTDNIQFIIETTGSESDKATFATFELPLTTRTTTFFETVLKNNEQYLNPDDYCTHKDLEAVGKEGACVRCKTCETTFNLLGIESVKDVEKAIDLIADAINTIKAFDFTVTSNDIRNFNETISELNKLPDNLVKAIKAIDNI